MDHSYPSGNDSIPRYGWEARLIRRRALGAAAIGAGTVAVACGRKTAGRTSGRPAAAPQVPHPGGTLTVHQSADPSDWDATYLGRSSANIGGVTSAYETLISFKAGPSVQHNELVLQPQLAEKWETPDGRTFTFHLRPGVKFADLAPVNGRPLTSDDIKWSYDYESRTGPFKDKKLAPAWSQWMFVGLTDIQTPDPSTVVIRFDQPYVPFLNYIAYGWNPIVPHEIYDLDGHLKNRLAGTGPFQLDEASSQRGTHWVFKKNPNYWDKDHVYLDQINDLVIADDSTVQAAFVAKQIDILTGAGETLSTQTVGLVKQQRPDAIISQYVRPAPIHLYIQTSRPPLNDIRVRQAISYALDRDEWVKTFADGGGGWALAGALPDTFTQDEIRKMLRYDPTQAKQLLSSAGFPNGLDLDMPYPGNYYGNVWIQQMELLQAQMKKVGINLVTKTDDFADFLSKKHKGDYSVIFTGKALAPDVDSYLSVFQPGSTENYGYVDDPVLTPLLVAQRQEADPAKRLQIVRQAVQRINVDKVWGLALFSPVGYDVWSPGLKNYATNFGREGWPVTNSWLAS